MDDTTINKNDLQQAAREFIEKRHGEILDALLALETHEHDQSIATHFVDFAAEQIAIAVDADKARIRDRLETLRFKQEPLDAFANGYNKGLEDVRALVTEGR